MALVPQVYFPDMGGHALVRRVSRGPQVCVQAQRVPVGLRPMPEDGLPIIGFPNKSTRIYVTLMHSGVTLAPIVGALGALEIATESSVNSLKPYRPTRFN